MLARVDGPGEPGRGGEPPGDKNREDQGGGELPSARGPSVHRPKVYSPVST